MKMNVRIFSALSGSANTPAGGSTGPAGAQGITPPPSMGGRSRTMIIAVVLVIVLIVAGLGIYLSLSKSATTPQKPGVLSSYASYSVASQGTAITFYSGTTISSSSIKNITWNFGDGVVKTYSGSTGLSVQYVYPNPGNYLVYDQLVTTSNFVANNSFGLVPVSITPSVTSTEVPQQFPAAIQVASSSANSQNLSAGFPNVVSPGGYIDVTYLVPSSYSSYPITAGWALQSMTFSIGTKTSSVFNATQVGNGVDFNGTSLSAGIYPMTLTAVTNKSTTTSTWTFVQTAAVGAYSPKHSTTPSTHSGIVDATWIPGGFSTLDPAIAYDTVSYEAIYNLYEPLVQYAPGTSASSYIPVLATAVPTQQNGLLTSVTSNGVTYVNYTFNLNPSAKFANGQPVTSYDVYFSVLRGLLFANDPGRPGWLTAHALIPGDSIYGYFNTSPFWVNHAMTMKNSSSITFHILPTTNQSLFGVSPESGTNAAFMATGTQMNTSTALANGLATTEYSSFGAPSYFMQLLVQPIAFVMDAAWANASGAGIGSFSPTAPYSMAFLNYSAYGNPSSWNTKLQFGTMGTGPYVIQALVPGQMISFIPNQNFTQTIDYPSLSAMQPTITIYYYTSESVAQLAFQTGAADFAEGAYPPSSFPQVLSMIHAGQAGSINTPQLALFTWFFVTQVNVTALKSLASAVSFPNSSIVWENASGQTAANAAGSWEVSTFFGNLSVRRAFTYAFDQAQYVAMGTNSGISTATNLTGYIPNGLADYPTNISKTPTAPTYNMTLAKQYWNSSPYKSASANSIQFPIFSISGSPIQDKMIQSYWVPAIENATNHSVKPYLADVNFATLLTATAVPAGQNPMPLYFLGWIADYPDPTDFAAPFVQPLGIYSFPDGWYPGPGFNQTTNPHQWSMINAMWNASAAGAGELNAAQRAYDYWLSDSLSVRLDMIVGNIQPIGIVFYRSWIKPASLDWSLSPSAALTFLILFPVSK